ncbi:MAG: folate family ECF transporter S component [Clostridia bacterium]|nr:folate family ECF transporter S component [Clostridia bacterium]
MQQRFFSTKRICLIAVFIALTVVLSMVSNLRIGNYIEISFKFIPVFVMGALFGPVLSGLTSLLGDVVTVMMFTGGAPLIGLFVTEFVSGFIYGVLFYNNYEKSVSYIVRMVICVLLQFALSLFVNSYILYSAGYFSTFAVAIGIRFWASFSKIFMHAAVIIFAPYYLKVFSKLIY